MKEAHDKGQLFNFLLGRVREIIEESSDTNERLLAICKLLMDNVPHYDWVGFYLVDQSSVTVQPVEVRPADSVD